MNQPQKFCLEFSFHRILTPGLRVWFGKKFPIKKKQKKFLQKPEQNTCQLGHLSDKNKLNAYM